MLEKELQVLQILNKNSDINQRDIAELANISIGKVNSMLKDFSDRGFIIIKKESRKPRYILSNKAIEALEKYIKDNLNKKILISDRTYKKVKQAVILAAGERTEFKKPVGFMELEDTSIVQRSINILREQGIEKIIIVTGYESKYYEELEKCNGDIYLIKNDKYKWTGTMYSLSLTKELITDDFLLIENDMVFEERAVSQILNNINHDCILITNESGSGDEAFVEIRNNYLYKMSKDIHQFNKIDGEMIGISKISLDIFKKMLDEFKDNKNPYLNYEYSLLDIARSYNIGYVKINDLVWSEVDNAEHYKNLKNYVYPRLKRKETQIRIQNIKDYIINALNVKEEDIKSLEPFGGMTNKNYKASINDKDYVVRIPGAGTEDMISRKDEKVNSHLAYKIGLDTEIIYFNDESGVKIAQLIENAETLNGKTSKREDNMRLTTDILKKLHESDIQQNNNFDLFGKIVQYEELLKRVNGKNYEDYLETREKIFKLKDMLLSLGFELKPCHNDTVPENFIKSGEDKIYLIDWEYGGMNDPMWDIAAHSLECNFSECDEELFLKLYFGDMPNEKYRKRILIHKICQDFLWSIWTNIKEAKGDNFGTYGIDRYNRAKKNLNLLKTL